MRATYVTTLDNPFNYFTQFDDWYAFDTSKGYNTCAYVDRVAETWPSMSEGEEKEAINEAVEAILKINITGNYIKVVDEDDEDDDVEPNFEDETENDDETSEKEEKVVS